MRVVVGTYTRGGRSRGIYGLDFDPTSGELRNAALAAETDDPSYLAVSADGQRLYCTNELDDGRVSAYAIERRGLRFLNTAASHGAHPAHLSVHPSGRWLLLANYTGGTIASLPIQRDGSLGEARHVERHTGSGPNLERQEGPHPHMIVTDPDEAFVLVPDLGMDAVLAYRLDDGRLIAAPDKGGQLPPGSGPRHLAFGNGHVYVLNELASTLVAHAYQNGRLQQTQIESTLPDGFSGRSSTSALVMAPSGRFLYASNRGHDSIAVFEIDQATGGLLPRGQTPTGGRTPRDFNIDPNGRYLLAANQASDSIATFVIDEHSGAMQATGHSIEVPQPVCVRFV